MKKITDLFLDSTAYGISNVFKRKNIISKLFWVLFVVFGVIASTYYTFVAVNEYLNYEIITSIEQIYEHPLKFPTFTFCSNGYDFENKSLNEIIARCDFNQDSSCKENANNYFEIFSKIDFGVCFRFNSGKNLSGDSILLLYSTTGGRDDSFRLTLNAKSEIFLWIHDSESPPKFESGFNHGSFFYLSPKSYTQLIIDKTLETRLDYPYNDCVTY